MPGKYFIAIVIPEPFQSEIQKMKLGLLDQFNLRGALRSPAHITLHRPFEFKKEEVLLSKLEQFPLPEGFEIRLLNFDFFEPRVVFIDVVHSESLFKFQNDLSRFCQTNFGLLNETRDTRGFHPHVTIAFRDLKKNLFPQLREKFNAEQYQASFKVQGFSVLKLESTWKVLRTYAPS